MFPGTSSVRCEAEQRLHDTHQQRAYGMEALWRDSARVVPCWTSDRNCSINSEPHQLLLLCEASSLYGRYPEQPQSPQRKLLWWLVMPDLPHMRL